MSSEPRPRHVRPQVGACGSGPFPTNPTGVGAGCEEAVCRARGAGLRPCAGRRPARAAERRLGRQVAVDTTVRRDYHQRKPHTTHATGRSQHPSGRPRRRRADRRLRPRVARAVVRGRNIFRRAARRRHAGPRSPAEHPRVAGPPTCVTCHNDRLQTGGLSLEADGFHDVGRDTEAWERVITQAAVADDAAGGAGRGPSRPATRPSRGVAGSHHRRGRRRSPATRAGPRRGASIGPSTPTPSETCWGSRSTPGPCCRPTTGRTASTTTPTCCRCRRRCSSAT